ncbi:hypothetical protein AURDEDRAFT_113233 [Auricularia subglabra TFB-10046 SS5]|nr:hypothetical protein AURDEDRAFT_113233 [Auricularia subglabra TFB-10046 SS5]
MSRVAASLQYLVIYNATLQPPESTPEDDEDAQEQAQIVFYTASERAVSRDRMLRQVGLARALVSFTETFAAGATCDNVHAQGKRLIMVSPEPDYWLHASVAVARTPRPAKSKAGESSSPSTQPMVYHEHSVHDAALRAHLLRGYEDFKLLHGTFSSILAQTNGRQTLERLLERFFTVWAWAWDLESSETLREHLGVSSHPLAKALSPTVEEYCSQLPDELVGLVVTSSHVVPTDSASRVPQSLLRHLISLSPVPTPTPVTKAASTRRSRMSAKAPGTAKSGGTLGFFNTLHMPTMSVGSMDVTKWNWSGYLTFGAGSKNNSTSTAAAEKASRDEPTSISVTTTNGETVPLPPSDTLGSRVEVHSEIDTKSLSDALNEDSVESPQDQRTTDTTADTQPPVDDSPVPKTEPASEADSLPDAVSEQQPESITDPPVVPAVDTSAPQPPPPPDDLVTSPIEAAPPHVEFSSFTAHLPELLDGTKSSALMRRRVYHLNDHGFTVAVILPATAQANGSPFAPAEQDDTAHLVTRTSALLQELRLIVDREANASPSTSKPSSAAQPTQHLLALRNGLTAQGSSGFASTSPYLFECEHLIDVDAETEEVFSRTTNPARWYVANRLTDGELYLENARKEASLVDVDDEVATLRRRYAA